MPSTGTLIIASDYNSSQIDIQDVLGIGENGYGLTLLSSYPVDTPHKNYAYNWNALQKDINFGYAHVFGVGTSTGYVITGTSVIDASYVTALSETSTLLTDNDDIRYTCHPNKFYVNTFSNTSTLISDTGSVRTLAWGANDIRFITHKSVASFKSRLSARYYFNSGCYITFLPGYVGTGLNDLDTEWVNFIDYLSHPDQQYRYDRHKFVNYSSTTTSWTSGTLQVSVLAVRAADDKSIEFTTRYANNDSSQLIVSPTVGYFNILA